MYLNELFLLSIIDLNNIGVTNHFEPAYLSIILKMTRSIILKVFELVKNSIFYFQTLTNAFRRLDTDLDGVITIHYEQFLGMVFNLKT